MTEHPVLDRDTWDAEAHTHCRCGSRMLPMTMPWQGPLCAGCGHTAVACRCRDTCCESCGWGPT